MGQPQRRVRLKIVQPGVVPVNVLRRFELECAFLGRLQRGDEPGTTLGLRTAR
jgi:hypothetical protein